MRSVGDKFSLVITSDPQYPWYDSILPPGLSTEAEIELNSQRQIVQQYESVNDLKDARSGGEFPVQGAIINGDLTAFGHGFQLDKFKEMVALLEVPTYPGLGNHDYSNNVDDSYNNDAATRMVNYMYSWLKASGELESYDFSETSYYLFPELRTDFHGSMSYSFNLGPVHVIQLQNFPSYEDEWNSWNGGAARRDFFFIRNSFDWLEHDLALARNRGDMILVNLHDYHDSFIEPGLSRFNDLVAKYQVSAVFAGHIHQSCGKVDTIPMPGTPGIPVFRSGAASFQDYLVADVDVAGRTLRISKFAAEYLEPYEPTGDVWGTVLYAPKPDPPLPVPPLGGFARVRNDGGFAARFTLRYTHNGMEQSFGSGDMALGNEHRFEIPVGASKIHLKGEEQTGLVWEGWRTVFDLNFDTPPNKCFRLYGTTLSPKWDNECG